MSCRHAAASSGGRDESPDVIADFTSIQLEATGENRVRLFGIKGRPPTDSPNSALLLSALLLHGRAAPANAGRPT